MLDIYVYAFLNTNFLFFLEIVTILHSSFFFKKETQLLTAFTRVKKLRRFVALSAVEVLVEVYVKVGCTGLECGDLSTIEMMHVFLKRTKRNIWTKCKYTQKCNKRRTMNNDKQAQRVSKCVCQVSNGQII